MNMNTPVSIVFFRIILKETLIKRFLREIRRHEVPFLCGFLRSSFKEILINQYFLKILKSGMLLF